MKYRYTQVTRKFTLFFSAFSFFVIVLDMVGIYRYGYITVPNFILILLWFIGTLLTTAYIIAGYEEFDIKAHKNRVGNFEKIALDELPTIDILLPCAGEDLATLERTYQSVNLIDYPRQKKEVYVLDDKGDFGVEKLAIKYGFRYLSRPNKGEKKKAGNLKYGFEHSNGKYILVLDADFAPNTEIVRELLPYLETDPEVGIVQSPQDFVLNKDEPVYLQKGDIGVQEFFYRICEVARNAYDASICVGTNALYRREALKRSGGFYQIDHSEDVHTGVRLIRYGYKIVYIPIVLAAGFCPSNYYQLFKQRSRWCMGSLSLMRSRLFWATKLSLKSRLCYISGFLYYLNSFVAVILPLHTLYLLSTPEKSGLIDILFFLPSIIYLIFSSLIYYYPRFSFAVLGNQFFFYWTYLFVTLKEFVFGKKEEWVATGAFQPKRNNSYKILMGVIVVYIAFYWSWFIFMMRSNSFSFSINDGILLFWIAYNAICQLSFVVGLVILAFRKPKLKMAAENTGVLIHLLHADR